MYYISADETIASVDQDGIITPHAAGKTTIRVFAEDFITSITNDQYVASSYKTIDVIVSDGTSSSTALSAKKSSLSVRATNLTSRQKKRL